MLLKYTKIKCRLKICSGAKAMAEPSPQLPPISPWWLQKHVPKGEQYLRNFSKTINQESWFVHIFFFSFLSWGEPPTESYTMQRIQQNEWKYIYITHGLLFCGTVSVNSLEGKKKMCVCLCVVWFLNSIIAAVQTFIISCYKIRNSLKHREAENSSISLAFVPGFKQSKLRMHVVFT